MSKIKITLNGEDYLTKNNQTISGLIVELELDTDKIAVEKNLEIVASENFDNEAVSESDKIEIVSFIGGG